MSSFAIKPIGKVQKHRDTTSILIYEPYRKGLLHLNDFHHLNILWWFHHYDSDDFRLQLQEHAPYQNTPEILGVFATRSPYRPNPIALSCCDIISIDNQAGIIDIAYIDADNDSPVLDIKPYMPSLDRIEQPNMPQWCADWPISVESSEYFDWSKVFNF